MFKRAIEIIFLTMLLSLGFVEAQTWQEIKMHFPSGDTLLYSSNIMFVTKNIGWIGTSGPVGNDKPPIYYATKIFRTIDGGNNWSLKYIDSSYGGGLFFADSLNCWAYKGTGDLLFTSDGGATWDIHELPMPTHKIYFFNNEQGIALSDTRPWFTVDGGNSWTAGDSSNVYLAGASDVDFVDRKQGWIVSSWSHIATDAGYIANTTDSGKTWNYQDSLTGIMYGVDFVDSLVGFAVGTNVKFSTGFIYATMDEGKHWTLKQDYTSGPMLDVGFLNKDMGWITGTSGRIWRTTDGGANWNLQTINTDATLGKIIILRKDSAAYVFGGNPSGFTSYINPFILLYTKLSNITEVREDVSKTPMKYFLSQNYPNPFNPSTTLNFRLPVRSFVKLTVYDILGREAQIVINKNMEAGTHTVKWNASGFPNGIYIARLIAGDFAASIKLILIK